MKNFKKVESNELKNLGLSQDALNIYNNSDWSFYLQSNNLYQINVSNDVVSSDNTIQDLNKFLLEL